MEMPQDYISLNDPGIRTSAVTILSSEHGRLRRAQRAIDKRELQAAVKYGDREQAGHCRRTGAVRWKYTYAGVVFVTDETSRYEITSWPVPGTGLDVAYVDITEQMKRSHDKACRDISTRKSSWTSHTVAVVDQSGSMRKTDVEGGATRSDAVWVVLALEFIARQLTDGSATCTDVLSLIVMREGAEVVIDKQPMDWTLFNSVIDLLHSSRPMEHGNYLPALQLAEELLTSNSHGSCALMLCFLSDGQPSDRVGRSTIFGETLQGKKLKLAVQRIEALASRFGRRLTIATIGFSGTHENFQVLQGMTNIAKMYGSTGVFKSPMLNADALSDVFTSLSQTLTSTKTEMTALGSSSQRVVRSVLREPAVLPDEFKMSDNWLFYASHFVKCTHWDDEVGWAEATRLPAEIKGVAMRKRIFGEGAERMVRQFRFVAHDDTFIGEKMVAKESRYLEDVSKVSNDDLKRYQKTFCQTQLKAQTLAERFNERLENLPGIKAAATPRLEFLACSVYLVRDVRTGHTGLLVEKMLPPEKYKKWNNNAGFVDGQVQHLLGSSAGRFSSPAHALINPLNCKMSSLQVAAAKKPLAVHHLPALEEDSEEELDTEDEDIDYPGSHSDGGLPDEPSSGGSHAPVNIRPEDIPQAFSHFTYIQSSRRMLVCDLQGVLTAADDANPPVFELTDPVIHYKSSRGNRNTYGRTDHGTKGMSEFLKTHKCSSLCRMVNMRWCNGDTFSQQQP